MSRYVVEKSPDFGVSFRRVVLSGGEVVYRCVKCPCVFSSLHDVELHVTVCGKKRESEAFEYGNVGFCFKVKKPIRNTIDNVLRCSSCCFFRDDGRFLRRFRRLLFSPFFFQIARASETQLQFVTKFSKRLLESHSIIPRQLVSFIENGCQSL